jgi:hypothetical protein
VVLTATFTAYRRGVRILVSPDGRWRIEPRRDGLIVLWRAEPELRQWTALLTGVGMDQVVAFLLDRGVDPADLREA